MNTYWIVFAMLCLIAFTIGEVYVFRHPERQNTLSRAIAELGSKWPMSIALWGLFIGILLSHFFWPWAANPLGPGGG